MDLEYFVEPVFKIDFLKIKCDDWKNKKTNLKTTMDQFAEIGRKEYLATEIMGEELKNGS